MGAFAGHEGLLWRRVGFYLPSAPSFFSSTMQRFEVNHG